METLCMVSSHPTLYDHVGKLLESQEWSDCSFRVGNEIFRAHKLILGISSPVFKVMLYGSMAESREIVISDIDPDVFQLMIDFIYRDKVKINSIEVGIGLLYAAKKYMIENLVEVCVKYIEKTLSTKNVMAVLPFVNCMQEELLVTKCLNLICKHGYNILAKNLEFLPQGSCLHKILKQNYINIDEKDLILLADRWAHSECVEDELVPDKENKRMVLLKSGNFALLRFFTLNVEDLDWMKSLDILTDDEKDLIEKVICDRAITDSYLDEMAPRVKGLNSTDLNLTTVCRLPMKIDWMYCCRSAFRTIAPLLIERYRQNIRVMIKCNKTVFISSFLVPTRQSVNDMYTDYKENIELTIQSNECLDGLLMRFNTTVNYDTSMNIELPKPFVFNEEEWYTLTFTWLEVRSPPYKYPLCVRPVNSKSGNSIFTFNDNLGNLMTCGGFVQNIKFCI